MKRPAAVGDALDIGGVDFADPKTHLAFSADGTHFRLGASLARQGRPT